MYLKHLFVSVLVLALIGCVSTGVRPTQTTIEKSRTYSATFDEVWTAIIAGIAESNLSITTLEKDSGIIAISNSSYELNWANEGTPGSVLGAKDQITERMANFNILATRQNQDQTRVQVNSNFKMKLRSGNGSQAFPYKEQWYQSYSNGTLEKLILNGVGRRVASK